MARDAATILSFDVVTNKIVVTPANPLVINDVEVRYPDVEIKGGVISTTVRTMATFDLLTKTS